MTINLNLLARIHHFLGRYRFYPLVLASILACLMVEVRMHVTHTGYYRWLIWNLALAWAPYAWSLWAVSIHARWPHQRWRLLLPGGLWLIFLPNAPYIVTDFMHINWLPSDTLWYDSVLVATFAWTGCLLGLISLHVMQDLIARLWGKLTGWCFVLASLALCGVGIYLGRFQRWNSWDVLLNPRALLADVLGQLADQRAFSVTVVFAAFLLVCYLSLPSLGRGEPERA